MSWIIVKEKKEQRAKLIHQAGAITKLAHSEKRELTPEESKQFDEIHQTVELLQTQIDLLHKQATAEDTLEDVVDESTDVVEESASRNLARPFIEQRNNKPQSEQAEQRNKAFNKFLRGQDLTQAEKRALTVGGSTTGAEAVPQGFYEGFYTKLRNTGSIRLANPTVINSSDGRSVPYPLFDDTSNEGEIITAGGTSTVAADPATSKLTLGGHIFSSKIFAIAKDFASDVAFDVESMVQNLAVERIGAHADKKFTIGTGTGEPQGCVVGASAGKTASAVAAVTYNEVLDLIHSLAPQYRQGAYLMFNDTTLLAIKKLVDNEGNNIWFAGASNTAGAQMSPTIAGVPYIVNPYVASMAASAKSMLIGNFTQGYLIRDVAGAELVVDPFTGFAKYVINYCMFSRHDGGVINSAAIKVLVHPAS